MTVQVQSLPINNEFILKPTVSISPTQQGQQPLSVSTRSRVLSMSSSSIENLSPRVQTFGLGLPSPPPERDDDSLPIIHSGSVESLIQSGIIDAALASAANQPDAEAAFFVADLGHIYRQYIRWQRYLPNVTPFYGKSGPIYIIVP
jgi:hypothetical protein